MNDNAGEQSLQKTPKLIKGRLNRPDQNWCSSSRGSAPVLQERAPVESAREFVRHVFARGEAPCLIYYRGGFYEWLGSHYEECDAAHLRAKLYKFLDGALTSKGEPFNPNPHKVNQILDALQSAVEQNAKRNAAFWIAPGGNNPDHLIACGNGLLDIETQQLLPLNPAFFNVNCLPFNYDRNAPTSPKTWMTFLRQLYPGDEDGKQARFTLQEIFGLMLTPDTRHQKIFMIVGPKRSGKGTIARVLTALLGKDNVCCPTLAGLSSHFGLSPLIDKRAAIISDARLGPQTNAHVVAERLLSISGEDALTIDRKYREPWTGRLHTRFLILTNELPRIADSSGALASRFVLLTMSNSFYGKEDLDLIDKLLLELSGILNWSLVGLKRLRERGRFEMPQSSRDAIQQLEDLGSPVSAFLRDWCEIGKEARITVRELYDAYIKWSKLEGHKTKSNAMFGRDLRAIAPLIRVRGRAPDRFYEGIALSKQSQQPYEEKWRSR
jgi:putative DNA primase/helicase